MGLKFFLFGCGNFIANKIFVIINDFDEETKLSVCELFVCIFLKCYYFREKFSIPGAEA